MTDQFTRIAKRTLEVGYWHAKLITLTHADKLRWEISAINHSQRNEWLDLIIEIDDDLEVKWFWPEDDAKLSLDDMRDVLKLVDIILGSVKIQRIEIRKNKGIA